MKCQLNFIFFFFFFFFFSFFFAELIELLSLSKRNIAEACLAMAQEKYKNFRLFSESQNVYFTLSKVLDPKKKKKFSNCKEPKYIYIYISFFVKPAVQTDPCHFNKIVRQMYGHLCPNRTHYSCQRLVALTVSEISH